MPAATVPVSRIQRLFALSPLGTLGSRGVVATTHPYTNEHRVSYFAPGTPSLSDTAMLLLLRILAQNATRDSAYMLRLLLILHVMIITYTGNTHTSMVSGPPPSRCPICVSRPPNTPQLQLSISIHIHIFGIPTNLPYLNYSSRILRIRLFYLFKTIMLALIQLLPHLLQIYPKKIKKSPLMNKSYAVSVHGIFSGTSGTKFLASKPPSNPSTSRSAKVPQIRRCTA